MNPQSGVNLGSAYGDITIGDNIDQALDKATRGFDNALSRIGDSISRVGDSMTRAGTAISVAMLPVAGVFQQGLQTASSYEDALKEIQARAGLTAEELARVDEKAMQLGETSVFSSQQAVDAFLQLVTSGSSVEEAFMQIDAVVAGAAANGTELGYTADALTNVLAAFQLEAGESAAVMQTLTAATGASSATFNDLIDGLANAGPVLANFGMSAEESAAAIAVLRDTGISGAEAGTQLKSMLTNMARQTDDVTGMWNRLGISLYDAQGNMRDLDSIIDDLNIAMEGMNDQERNDVITTLAGSYGQVGLSALLAADGLDTMTTSMAEQGTMEEIAKARTDSYSGRLDELMSVLETIAIKVMTPFMNDVLKPMIEYLTENARKVSAWADANKPLVMTILKVVSVLMALGPVMIGLGLALQVIGPAISALGVAIGMLMSPITLVIAGVGALAYVFRDQLGAAVEVGMGWITAFGDFIHFFISDLQNVGLGQAIAAMFGEGAIGREAGSSLEGLLFRLGFSREAAIEITADIFPVFADWFIQIRNAFDRMQGIVAGPIGKIRAFVLMFFSDLKIGVPVLNALQNTIGAVFGTNPVITGFVDGAIEKFGQFQDALRSTFERIVNAVGPALNQIGIFIGNNLEQIGAFAWSLFEVGRTMLSLTNPIGILATVFKVLGVDLMAVFESVMQGVTVFFMLLNTSSYGPLHAFATAISTVFGGQSYGLVSNFFTVIGGWIGQLQGWIFGTALPALQNFGNWFMSEGLPAMVGFVTGTVMPAINSFINTVASIWTRVQPALMSLGNWFMVDVLPQLMSILTDSLMPLLASVASWLGDIWLIAQPHLIALADWFLVSGLPMIQSFISETVLPVIQGLIDGLSALWNDVSPYLTSLFDWFMNTGLVIVKDFIFTDVLPVIENFINLLAGIWERLSGPLGDFYNWVMDTGLKAISDWLGGAATQALNAYLGVWGTVLDIINQGIDATREFLGLPSPTQVGGGGQAGHLNSVLSNAGNNVRALLRDSGGPGYPGVPYMIGTGAQPEMFIPDTAGSFVPNADQMGGKNFYMTIESITAATMQEAAALGDTFGNAFMRTLHNSGYAED